MTAFFPNIAPFNTGRFVSGDGHDLFWQECGNPDGVPLLFLHGGPGSGCSPKYRRVFDPQRFRIILLDQRGAGQSRPVAGLANNTTAHLIDDLEVLRGKLGLERWVVYGPSWGSTLALAYAQAHPHQISGLVVQAVFLGTRSELDWWHSPDGLQRFFPDAWADFIAPVPQNVRNSATGVMQWYLDAMREEQAAGYPLLADLATASIEELRRSAVYRWTEYEDRTSYLENTPQAVLEGLRDRGADFIASHSLIEAHYFNNGCFLEPDQLIRDAHRLAKIPMAILHSRYDMVCPPQSAFRLSAACPHADFRLVALNGHGMTETTQLVLREIMSGFDR